MLNEVKYGLSAPIEIINSQKLMISIGALHKKNRFEIFWLKLQPK